MRVWRTRTRSFSNRSVWLLGAAIKASSESGHGQTRPPGPESSELMARPSATPFIVFSILGTLRAGLSSGALLCLCAQGAPQPGNDALFKDSGIGPDSFLPAQVTSERVNPRFFRDV